MSLFRRYVAPEEEAYRRLKAKQFAPASIIDVGAYEGNWTRLALKVFPDARVLMVEPQAAKAPALAALSKSDDRIRFEAALLGKASGDATFYEMETGSSMFSERSDVPRTTVTLPVRTLDSIATDLESPIFLKIDVQGAERDVLDGAANTLQRCALVQLEVAFLPYNEGAPTFLDMVRYMDDRDFVPLDISGYSRPNGIDLAQVDLLFARRESELRRTFFEFRTP